MSCSILEIVNILAKKTVSKWEIFHHVGHAGAERSPSEATRSARLTSGVVICYCFGRLQNKFSTQVYAVKKDAF